MPLHSACAAWKFLAPPPIPPLPTAGPDADFDAIKGIIAASGFALLFFWLPLALIVVRARGQG